jgi:hypothetical protein
MSYGTSLIDPFRKEGICTTRMPLVRWFGSSRIVLLSKKQ